MSRPQLARRCSGQGGDAAGGSPTARTCAWKRDRRESKASWGGGGPYMPASGSATAAAASSAASSAPKGRVSLRLGACPLPLYTPCCAAPVLQGWWPSSVPVCWGPTRVHSAAAATPPPAEAPTAEPAAEEASEAWRCACSGLRHAASPCCSAVPAVGAIGPSVGAPPSMSAARALSTLDAWCASWRLSRLACAACHCSCSTSHSAWASCGGEDVLGLRGCRSPKL